MHGCVSWDGLRCENQPKRLGLPWPENSARSGTPGSMKSSIRIERYVFHRCDDEYRETASAASLASCALCRPPVVQISAETEMLISTKVQRSRARTRDKSTKLRRLGVVVLSVMVPSVRFDNWAPVRWRVATNVEYRKTATCLLNRWYETRTSRLPALCLKANQTNITDPLLTLLRTSKAVANGRLVDACNGVFDRGSPKPESESESSWRSHCQIGGL